MNEQSTALLAALRELPPRDVSATMRNPRSSADRTFRGPSLYDYAVATGLLPAKLGGGNLADGYFLVTAEDGMRVAVALAEVWPNMASKDVILATEQDGEPIRNGVRMVLTGDGLAGRSIGGVVSVEAKRADPDPGAAGRERGVVLGGLLERPGRLDLTTVPAEAMREVETIATAGHAGAVITPRRYGGAHIYALLARAGIRLDPAWHEDFLSKVIVATSADGNVVVLAGGELEPRFMDGPAILATTREGAALAADASDEGGVRLVVPWDRKPGRWAKSVVSLELREG
jgi:hypothetical protein